MGDALRVVVEVKHSGETAPAYMKTAMLIFGTKPKKPQSIQPIDKRRLIVILSYCMPLGFKRFLIGCFQMCIMLQELTEIVGRVENGKNHIFK